MSNLLYQTRASLRTSYSSTPRHRLVEFGDGYIQRTPLGLNNQRRSLTVVHEALTQAEATQLITYYEGRHSTAGRIDISSSNLLDSAGKFYLESFDVEMNDDSSRTITATMTEVFDL